MLRAKILTIFCALVGLSACQLSDPVTIPPDTSCPTQANVDGQAILLLSVRMRQCQNDQTSYGDLRAKRPDFAWYDASQPSRLNRASEADWRAALTRQVIETQKPPIIFIHGYFNAAEEGNQRAAELRAIVGDWPIVSVTWPSYGQATKYFWDEANNEFSLILLRREIQQIAHHHPGTTLIAHSMGNRILLDAVLHSKEPASLFAKLIMASPDVDRGMLASRLSWAKGLGVPTTIYASRKDQALSGSWRLHGAPRAGDLSMGVRGRERAAIYRTLNNAQLVDTTPTRMSAFGHRDFTSTPETRVDLCKVINGGDLNETRAEYVRADEDGNAQVWASNFVLRKFGDNPPSCAPYRAPRRDEEA